MVLARDHRKMIDRVLGYPATSAATFAAASALTVGAQVCVCVCVCVSVCVCVCVCVCLCVYIYVHLHIYTSLICMSMPSALTVVTVGGDRQREESDRCPRAATHWSCPPARA